MTDAAVQSDHGVAGQSARRSVVVVIPTLDEEQSIAAVVRSLPRTIVARVIVADGGSRDATAARAKAAGAEVIEAGRGYGRACLMATMVAEGADIVVFMDGDGADDAASIARLVEPIRSGRYDFVIGSRARGNREPGSIAWHQLAAGRLAGWAMRLLYGAGYTDMCAFRAIRRDALLELGMRELTYGWNLEMQMRAARAGLRILEIPVDYRRRRGGNSKVAGSLIGTIRAGARILATFARISIETSRRARHQLGIAHGACRRHRGCGANRSRPAARACGRYIGQRRSDPLRVAKARLCRRVSPPARAAGRSLRTEPGHCRDHGAMDGAGAAGSGGGVDARRRGGNRRRVCRCDRAYAAPAIWRRHLDQRRHRPRGNAVSNQSISREPPRHRRVGRRLQQPRPAGYPGARRGGRSGDWDQRLAHPRARA